MINFVNSLLLGSHGHRARYDTAEFFLFIYLINVASAIETVSSPTIQQPYAENPWTTVVSYAMTIAPWITYIYPSVTAFIRLGTINLWYGVTSIWLKSRSHILAVVLWALCAALLVMSCIIEQEPSAMRLWLAVCLAVSWLILISWRFHKLIRRFQSLGRAESFIVATAMLSFVFIKAFAVSNGYNVAALIRVPPCLTIAAWITSHWCNFDATPNISINA